MSKEFNKPQVDELVEMMDMMLGTSTSATVTNKFDASNADFTALFVDDEGDTVATCRVGLPTAAAFGCALSMIPPGAAEAMIEDNELTQTATENLYEVMNMFSSLLMNDKSSHLKLTEVVPKGDVGFEGKPYEFTVEMGKYGTGYILFNVI